jgi:RNA polymerase sigma factor (sigma-70 family)
MSHPLYALIFAPHGKDDAGEHVRADSSLERTAPKLALSDAELVARVRTGDQDALSVIFQAYYPALVAFAASSLAIRADAEEEVSDVFEWIWEHRASWSVSATGIRAYLYRAVRNRVLNRGRERRREGMRYLRLAREEHETIVPRAAPVAAEQIIVTEAADAFAAALDTALQQMSSGMREVVALRANVGLTFEEIAIATDSTEAAVRKQWTRGLKFLREEFTRLLDDPRS